VPLLVGFLDNVNGDVELLKQVLTVLDLVIAKMKDHEGLKNLILKRQGEGEKQSLDSLLIALQQVSHARGSGYCEGGREGTLKKEYKRDC